MDIREKVLEIRTSRDKQAFVTYFVEDEQQRTALFQLIKDLEPYPYKEYASWILVHLCKSKRIDHQQYYNELVDILFKTEDQSVLRSIVCCLDQMKITDYRESDLIDQLIAFIQNFENKVALQVYSMRVLAQFCKKYPELKPEIIEIIELNREGKTAAYGSAYRNFLKSTRKK
jgi:hypothetical protein